MNSDTIQTMNTTQTTSLTAAETKQVTVDAQRAILPGKMETPEFEKLLLEEFAGKHSWRSSSSLGNKLQVDAKELEVYLDKDKRFLRRLGDGDAVLYAIGKRVEDTPDKKTAIKQVTIKPQDRYSLAIIRMIEVNLTMLLDKYSHLIYEENEEVMSHLTKSLKHIQSAKVLYAQSTKADLNNLI